MSTRLNLRLVTVAALAIAAMSFPAFAGAARDRAAATTEFSAQEKKEEPKNKTKVVPKRVAPKQVPARVAPKQAQPHVAPRPARPQVVAPKRPAPKVVAPKRPAPKVVAPVRVAPKSGTVTTAPSSGASKAARKTFTPRGNNAGVVTAASIRSAPARGAFRTSIRGHNYSVWRSGYRVRRGNGWQTFVAIGTLGALAIGTAEFYPYAYIDAPADYCDGLTEDGCQMVYDEVETMEGGVVGQCVAYCPWQ